MRYKAFISYSHAADGRLAPAIQSALQRFAKPWYRLRALRIFRDNTGLALTPELWPTIENALDESEYFVLFASPKAAASHWVQKEVQYWLDHKSSDKILFVLTDGGIQWDDESGDFNWNTTDSLPEILHGKMTHEPLYLDLRQVKDSEHVAPSEPKFRESLVKLAAKLHDTDPDEIAGEDVRQHKKTRRIATLAASLLFPSPTRRETIAAVLAVIPIITGN